MAASGLASRSVDWLATLNLALSTLAIVLSCVADAPQAARSAVPARSRPLPAAAHRGGGVAATSSLSTSTQRRGAP